jgi:ABC-type glycerol-3-phosphate transport system substrate-binding protein
LGRPQADRALKPFADQFGKDNGVTVTVKEIAENLQQTFVTASQQGSGPDIVIGAHDWIGNLVQKWLDRPREPDFGAEVGVRSPAPSRRSPSTGRSMAPPTPWKTSP